MVIAQIATRQGREASLRLAIESLMFQTDRINIIHNGPHDNWADSVSYDRDINHIYPPGADSSPSDGWKFYGLNNQHLKPTDMILICDDDIQYPPDFMVVMSRYLNRYGRPVMTVMGKIMQPGRIESFYRDELVCFKTFEDNEYLRNVEIPGTCGMAFYRETCPDLDHTHFETVNSDIWMGIYAKRTNLQCFVIPHRGDWLTNLMPVLPDGIPSVFDTYKNNDSEMTDKFNRYMRS